MNDSLTGVKTQRRSNSGIISRLDNVESKRALQVCDVWLNVFAVVMVKVSVTFVYEGPEKNRRTNVCAEVSPGLC